MKEYRDDTVSRRRFRWPPRRGTASGSAATSDACGGGSLCYRGRVVIGRIEVAGRVQKLRTHELSVAPMMDWTDRHCRYFHRLLSRRTVIYTEMMTTVTVLQGNRDRLLRCHAAAHPVVLHLGRSDPADLAAPGGYHEGHR